VAVFTPGDEAARGFSTSHRDISWRDFQVAQRPIGLARSTVVTDGGRKLIVSDGRLERSGIAPARARSGVLGCRDESGGKPRAAPPHAPTEIAPPHGSARVLASVRGVELTEPTGLLRASLALTVWRLLND
jgi:hypothetical protein